LLATAWVVVVGALLSQTPVGADDVLRVQVTGAPGLEPEVAFLSSRVAASFKSAVVVVDEGADVVVALDRPAPQVLALRISDHGGVVTERALSGSADDRIALAWVATRAAIDRALVDALAPPAPPSSSGLELVASLGVTPAPPFSLWHGDVGGGVALWTDAGPAVVRGAVTAGYQGGVGGVDLVGHGVDVVSHAAVVGVRGGVVPAAVVVGAGPAPFIEAVVDVAVGGAIAGDEGDVVVDVAAGVDVGLRLPLSSSLALLLRAGVRARPLYSRLLVDGGVVDEGALAVPVSVGLSFSPW
jgi:hypothetical protein